MFYCGCYIFIFFFFTARSPSSAGRSHETLPRDRKLVQFYNLGPKILGALPQKNGGPKRAKSKLTSDNFKLRSRMSPERMEISKIGKLMCRLQRIVPPKMLFFVRQKEQISSKILPQIPNFASLQCTILVYLLNFVKFGQKSIFSLRRPLFVISSVFRQK